MRKIAAALLGVMAVFAGAQAYALPQAPAPAPAIAGIPEPCVAMHPFPEDASISEIRSQMETNFGFKLEGKFWTKEYLPSIRIIWDTLDAVSCTPYVETLQSKQSRQVTLNAASIRGYAWGDWSLTKPGAVTLDLEKFKGALAKSDEGRLVRLVVHELAHTYNSDRYSQPKYWKDFQALHKKEGKFSDYAGGSATETWADAVGYYVGRCALNNPYDSGKHDAYYNFVKDRVFDGKEFGPKPGSSMDCKTTPSPDAQEPQPGLHAFDDELPAWVKDLTGE